MTQCQSQFPILSVVDRLPQYSSDWRGRISGHTVGRVTQSTKKSIFLARCFHYLHLEWASTYWSCLWHKSRLSPISSAQSWIWPVSLIYCDHIVIGKTSCFSKMFQICLWSMLRGIRSLEGWPLAQYIFYGSPETQACLLPLYKGSTPDLAEKKHLNWLVL